MAALDHHGDDPGGRGDTATVAALLRTLAEDEAWLEATLDEGEGNGFEPTQTRRPSVPPAELARRLLAQLRQDGGGDLRTADVLGMGGMGMVRAAEQTALGRTVAIKRVRADMQSEKNALRLTQEALVTGLLEHPNIVPVHDLGVDELGEPYLVLKRVRGDAWIDLLTDPDLLHDRHAPADPLAWHLDVLLEVCQAVAFAHDHGVLHRDLKPENVMIGAWGEVLLMDWGLAIGLDEADPRLPRASDDPGLVGTPAYLAPEMLPHTQGVPPTRATDVYLLGGCLFEILTGRPPRQIRTRSELVRQVLAGPPALPDDVPAGLAAVCRRALATEPADRFPTVDAFVAAIRDTLRHRDSARLAAEAAREAAALTAELAALDVDPQQVHARFGAVRFGVAQARVDWPDNPRAAEALATAAEAVARWELERGHPDTARSALADVDEPDPDLLRDLAQAEERAAAEAEALAAWQRDHDPRIGLGGRRLAILVIGGSVSLTPLTYGLFEDVTVGAPHLIHPWIAALALLAVTAPLVLGVRAAIGPFTSATRPVTAGLLLVACLQLVLVLGTTLLGLDPREIDALFFIIWIAIAAMLGALVDRRLWLGAAGYTAAFLATGLSPEWIFVFMAGANAVQTLAGLWAFGGFGEGRDAGPVAPERRA